MFKNFIKITFRHILKHKGYSLINITGLAIGLTCCILIMMWVVNELSYDRFHDNHNNITRLCSDLTLGGNNRRAAASSPPMGPAIVEEYPEAVNFTRINPGGRISITYQDREFFEKNILYADHSVFEVFTFPILRGDRNLALKTAYSAVITESLATKFFGDEDPVGKILKIDSEKTFTITGLIADVPDNSHIQFDMLFSFETLVVENPRQMEQWGRLANLTYLLMEDKYDLAPFEEKLSALIERNLGARLKQVGGSIDLFLQPLDRIHLFSNLEGELSGGGDIAQVVLFSGIALFVLLIACINFINLTTARSASRAREVGLRKTLGALKSKLVAQFLGESLLLTVIAMIFSMMLLILVLPKFNSLANRELQITFSHLLWLIPGMIGLALLVGLIAGSYPAFFLSSFQPVNVLKGRLVSGASNAGFRRFLVIVQFAISISLAIGTLTIYHQLRYMKTKPLGFQKENLTILPVYNPEKIQPESIRDEITNLSGVVAVGMSSTVPGGSMQLMNFLPEGFAEDESQLMFTMEMDDHYLETLGIQIVQGRNFSSDFITDPSESVLINETAAAKFGWDNPIGKTIQFTMPTPAGPQPVTKKVIGVIRNFHHQSLHQLIEPMIFNYLSTVPNMFSVRIEPGDFSHTIDQIRNTWKRMNPNQSFEYIFLDEVYDEQYQAEEKLGQLFIWFALLAVIIACLGLFGLAAFMAERRTREIGIRKVLGASVPNIIGLLSKEFMILVAVSNLIAWPAGYFAMKKWLTDFAYRTELAWMLFLLTGLFSLLIALGTVSYQSFKAARTNPADTIKYE